MYLKKIFAKYVKELCGHLLKSIFLSFIEHSAIYWQKNVKKWYWTRKSWACRRVKFGLISPKLCRSYFLS